MCGWAVNTSLSGCGGLGFKPRWSHCFLSQGTLLHLKSLCLFTQVYKWVPVTYCWGVTLAILLGMFHAKETRISSSRLGLWLVCALTFLPSYLAWKGDKSNGNAPWRLISKKLSQWISINLLTSFVPVTLKNFEALLLFTTGKKTLYS